MSLISVDEALQHANVYHVGTPTITEVDIILPQECPLVLAHNIGESVQMALESLSGCARAYVVRLVSLHEARLTSWSARRRDSKPRNRAQIGALRDAAAMA
jgi:hypothetical protein